MWWGGVGGLYFQKKQLYCFQLISLLNSTQFCKERICSSTGIFFPLGVDLILEGLYCQGKQTGVMKVVPLLTYTSLSKWHQKYISLGMAGKNFLHRRKLGHMSKYSFFCSFYMGNNFYNLFDSYLDVALQNGVYT